MPETMSTSRTVLITVPPASEASPRGPVYGGWIMTQIDHAAGLAGSKVSGGDALILSIKEMVFHAALTVGTEFTITAEVTRRGRTSFDLALTGTADPDGAAQQIVSSSVTMVAVYADGTPRPLP
ncbi:acyl-CoA thioesterase [Celeribacter sp.]|uniref:acyl-CoA thioesterase n=1 Tax=Celeribacter sp. TaxID=1890673 RepID=UPI003A8DC76E